PKRINKDPEFTSLISNFFLPRRGFGMEGLPTEDEFFRFLERDVIGFAQALGAEGSIRAVVCVLSSLILPRSLIDFRDRHSINLTAKNLVLVETGIAHLSEAFGVVGVPST